MTPYKRGDRVRIATGLRGGEYTVQDCYESEDGGWDLRVRDDGGMTLWVDSEAVTPIVDHVVETETQKDLGL